jgi:PAS domain S-box-containing protein
MAAIPDVPTGSRRNWLLPLFAAVCVLAATLVLAYAVRLRERHHIRHLTAMAAAAVQSDIEADLEARFLAPVRTTKLWDLPANVTRADWERAASTFLSEHPNMFAVAWATRGGRIWSIPEELGTHMAAGVTPAPDLRTPFPPARDPHFASAFADAHGERFRRIVLPLAGQSGPAGYGIVAFREHEAVEDLLADVDTLGYTFVLTEGPQEVFRHDLPGGAAPNAPTVKAEVNAPGIHWAVRAAATPVVMTDLQSHLTPFVVVIGTLFSFMVGLSVYFAQSARGKAENLTREIGERRRYEAALQASQARMNGIVETSADGIVAVDEHQRITLYNKGAESIFGYTAEEVMGKPLDLLIPQRFQYSHREQVEGFGREMAGPRRMAGPREVFGRKKDGTEFPIEASISRVDTVEGVTYTSIVRDVTERVRARDELRLAHQQLERRVEERTAELASANESLLREIEEKEQAENQLRESEQRLQGILDNCTACVFMKDVAGRYLLINRWYETLFNLTNEETVGKTDADIFPPQVAAELRENDRLVLRSQHPIEFEEHVAHPDGTVHTYIATKFLVRDRKGEPFAICGIATDITRQKQAEELLSELSGGLMALQDEERKRLSRELHEGTAQMLAALEMNLELAKKLAREDTQKAVGALDTSLDLVEQSASQLRTMAYLLHPPGLDDFGLAPALRWYADGFSTRSGIKVNVQVHTNDDRFARDIELAVFRIVQEALTNIVRHSGSKTAEIVLRQDGDDLEVEVHDTGRGISPTIMDRMSSGRTVPGIGIAGIRERVRQLGGIFGIQSGSDGVHLVAKLPLSRARSHHPPVATASPHTV